MFAFYQTPLKNKVCTHSDNGASKNNVSYIAQYVTLIISFQLPGFCSVREGEATGVQNKKTVSVGVSWCFV